MKYAKYIWLNGQIIELEKANFNIMTHAMHYGDGVFEGIRSYNSVPFKCIEHLERFRYSGKCIGFNIPYSIEELQKAINELLKINNMPNAYIRSIAFNSATSGGIYSDNKDITIAIIIWEWDIVRNSGYSLEFSDFIRPMPAAGLCQAKITGQYFINCVCKNNAIRNGYNDAIMMDYRGYVAECTGSNIFIIKDNCIFTPIADCFLNGITRQTVIAIAKQNNINIKEKYITTEELLDAEEIFISGTAAEIISVTSVALTKDKNKIFQLGEITQQMIALYNQTVYK